MATLYPLGRIVYAFMHDEFGENAKVRPAMVVNDEVEGSLVVMGITTSFDPEALMPGEYLLPHARFGRCETQLQRQSCLVARWMEQIEISTHVRGRLGFVPDVILDEVLRYLDARSL